VKEVTIRVMRLTKTLRWQPRWLVLIEALIMVAVNPGGPVPQGVSVRMRADLSPTTFPRPRRTRTVATRNQVTLHNGNVVEQKFWKDGEFKAAVASAPGLVSGN
jgi:hypothetical protein